eukprot:6891943-Heterocapsa_arctica.AAC.1
MEMRQAGAREQRAQNLVLEVRSGRCKHRGGVTTAAHYMNDIKEYLPDAFQRTANEGRLCEKT